MLERLRLPDTSKRIALRLPDDTNQPKGLSAIPLHPHARSSKAAESNSKLLNGRLEWDSILALLRSQQAVPHRLGPKQMCRFALGFDFVPEFDGHDDTGRLAILIGDDLKFPGRHKYSLHPPDY